MQNGTILHIALVCKVEHACFHGDEVGASFGEKVAREERTKEEKGIEQEHPH